MGVADLRGLTGTFQYEILGKSNVPAEAESLHMFVEGVREAAESGRFSTDALEVYAAAWFRPAFFASLGTAVLLAGVAINTWAAGPGFHKTRRWRFTRSKRSATSIHYVVTDDMSSPRLAQTS